MRHDYHIIRDKLNHLEESFSNLKYKVTTMEQANQTEYLQSGVKSLQNDVTYWYSEVTNLKENKILTVSEPSPKPATCNN